LDGLGPGGQAGSSSRIENYAGFPDGITGRELAHLTYLQALKFGADFVAPCSVAKFERSNAGLFMLESSEGGCVTGKAVILATGVSYNLLDIPSLDKLLGSGVFYSATKVEAQICSGSPVHVVGGGNSAGQAAMFLSQFASHVSLIVRGNDLRKSMSSYLLERVLANDKITIGYSTNVAGVEGVDYIKAVSLRNENGQVASEPTCGLFVFIGAKPKTEFIPPSVLKDPKGFILTGSSVAELPVWTEKRPPYAVETSLAGVFACGDCRSALTKRISFAIADGAVAAAAVDDLLSST
jgi:thioredoxin reductase (NADPH)